MFRTLLLILLAITPLTLNAEQHAHPAVGCIYYHKHQIAQVGDKIGNGSGGLISPIHFLTAYHVIDTMVGNSEFPVVWIKLDGHAAVPAKFLCGDKANDVAVLELLVPITDVQPFEIAKENVKPGQDGSMSVAGHRDYDSIQFKYGYFSSGTVFFNRHCWQGESGSMFLNVRGEVVGSLTGGYGMRTDSEGNIVERDCGLGWVTQSVRNSISESTALEIRALLKENGILEAVDKLDVIATAVQQENVLYVITMHGCPPCQYLKKQLKLWGKELEDMDVKVVIVNKDKDPEFVKQFGCKAFPTVVGVVGGRLKFKITGCPKKDQLFKKLKEALR